MTVESYKITEAPVDVAAQVLCIFNPEKVKLVDHAILGWILITNVEPNELVYPDGWHYNKGCLSNINNPTEEMLILKSSRKRW